jgi:hypothetical protein
MRVWRFNIKLGVKEEDLILEPLGWNKEGELWWREANESCRKLVSLSPHILDGEAPIKAKQIVKDDDKSAATLSTRYLCSFQFIWLWNIDMTDLNPKRS